MEKSMALSLSHGVNTWKGKGKEVKIKGTKF